MGIPGESISNSYHHYSNPHRNFDVIHFDRNLLSIKETLGQGEYGEIRVNLSSVSLFSSSLTLPFTYFPQITSAEPH